MPRGPVAHRFGDIGSILGRREHPADNATAVLHMAVERGTEADKGALIGAGAGALGGYLYDQHQKGNID